MLCNTTKLMVTYGKQIIYLQNYHVTQREILCQVFKKK